MTYFVAWLATASTFLLLDLVWLGVVAREIYNRQMGTLRAEEIGLVPAVAFYVIYVSGVVWLVLRPALEGAQGSGLASVALNAAILGLLAYGTYDLTNLATTRGWPPSLAVIDLCWGVVLTTLAGLAGYVAARALT